MDNQLLFLTLNDYQTDSGIRLKKVDVSYQVFGLPIGDGPVVLVNHALTGNSDVCSPDKGWWKSIIGTNRLIDTERYTVIAFNIPGNGYDGTLISKHNTFTVRDIARLFKLSLNKIGVTNLHAVIGGSLGGGIAWELAVLAPDLIKYVIPIASDWKSSDWIIGHNYIQDKLLINSKKPLQDVRMMAMLFYRTPASFKTKFNRTKTENGKDFNVNSWLQHHGDKLSERFNIHAYRLMNHLLTTIDITRGRLGFRSTVTKIKATIVQVAVDSDLFFVAEENKITKTELDELGVPNHYFEIKSIHGHDAFLIEFEQLTQFLTPFFK